MEERKGADPKHILAVQMTSIGAILLILGLTVLLLSLGSLRSMENFIRVCAIASDFSIILVGLFFAIGGIIRLRRVKKV